MNSTTNRQQLHDDLFTNNNIQQSSYSNTSFYINSKFYTLYIYIDSNNSELYELYSHAIKQHNIVVDSYLNAVNNNEPNMEKYCFNAGFDLFSPYNDIVLDTNKQYILDYNIKCCMKYKNNYVSYYLYPRSSLPIKTPFRLANSVGIIDSGYRGNIKAIFDKKDSDNFKFNIGNRFVQICPPNLEYPMKIILVKNLSDLGITQRSESGFGSSGS
tara:strand:+ start:504 stop:1145 length:642 start_codon:yes stop_codon:yes gene_type:complete